jgi:hypothetical protein
MAAMTSYSRAQVFFGNWLAFALLLSPFAIVEPRVIVFLLGAGFWPAVIALLFFRREATVLRHFAPALVLAAVMVPTVLGRFG